MIHYGWCVTIDSPKLNQGIALHNDTCDTYDVFAQSFMATPLTLFPLEPWVTGNFFLSSLTNSRVSAEAYPRSNAHALYALRNSDVLTDAPFSEIVHSSKNCANFSAVNSPVLRHGPPNTVMAFSKNHVAMVAAHLIISTHLPSPVAYGNNAGDA